LGPAGPKCLSQSISGETAHTPPTADYAHSRQIVKFLSIPKGKNRMNSPQSAGRPLAIRSAITNRPHALRGVDGRTMASRRYRDISFALADDLGGAAKLSESTQILIRQAAALTVQVESLQSKIVAGEDVDLEQLTRLSNVLGRTLQRLGLKKPAAPRGPTLAEVLAQHRAPQ
jgi:hypothetical protein